MVNVPMPNTSVAPKIASINKQVDAISKKISTGLEKATGTNKAPRVKPAGMPTHVGVEHGIKPPYPKNSSVLSQGQNAYKLPN